MGEQDGRAVLVLRGSVAPEDIPVLCRRARGLLERTDAELMVCDVGALADPDAVTVEALARVRLTAGRLGRRVHLRDPCVELLELIAFMGLADILL